jgi:hypothetical protein
MTDAAEFAGILERALLRRLLEPAHVVTCPVPANTTQADLDEARGITRQRLCETGQADLSSSSTMRLHKGIKQCRKTKTKPLFSRI